MSLHALISEFDAEADRYAERRNLPEGMPGAVAHAMGSVYRACARRLSAELADGGEAVAWMKRGGAVFVDYVSISKTHADRAAGDDKGAEVVPLYLHPAGAVQEHRYAIVSALEYLDAGDTDQAAAMLRSALNPGGSRE